MNKKIYKDVVHSNMYGNELNDLARFKAMTGAQQVRP